MTMHVNVTTLQQFAMIFKMFLKYKSTFQELSRYAKIPMDFKMIVAKYSLNYTSILNNKITGHDFPLVFSL